MIQARNFRYMKLHIHPHNKYDADGLKELLEKKILVEMVCMLVPTSVLVDRSGVVISHTDITIAIL